MTAQNQRNKRTALEFWAASDAADADRIASMCGSGVRWQGFAPLPDCDGAGAMAATYTLPLAAAFAGLKRQTHILIGGTSDGTVAGGNDGRQWVGGTGYLCGRQTAALWGIPARNRDLRLRWGEFLQFDAEGRITRIQTLIDVIDWLEQLGLSPLPPAKGVPCVFPAPTGIDGVILDEQPEADSLALLDYGRKFIFGGLNAFDRSDLKSMGMADYFHPNLKWYGPGGIGACLSFADFEDLHQRPWLAAFPDRSCGDLDNLIAEGGFVGASSLPGVRLTHTGPYLGHGASGARCGVNGIDFWRYENGRFTENWVFVDMVDLFSQMGIDLMARAPHMAGD